MHSSTSYLVQAIREWMIDGGLTPLLLVQIIDDENLVVPLEFVKDGQIAFNISQNAAVDLILGELVSFKARFHGVSQEIFVPWSAVLALYSRETQEGIYFMGDDVKLIFLPEEPMESEEIITELTPEKPKSKLTVVTNELESPKTTTTPSKKHLTLLK